MTDEEIVKFRKAFDQGFTFEEAADLIDAVPCHVLVDYWNLLAMEAAVASASSYFERMIELAA